MHEKIKIILQEILQTTKYWSKYSKVIDSNIYSLIKTSPVYSSVFIDKISFIIFIILKG